MENASRVPARFETSPAMGVEFTGPINLEAVERELMPRLDDEALDVTQHLVAEIRALRRHAAEWSTHQAWRCGYPQRYEECCCGLHEEGARLGLPLTPRPDHDAGKLRPPTETT
jgi:hypothetical protein